MGLHVLRTKVMHGFRDTVCDMLGLRNMGDFSADQWTGHVNQFMKGKHYRSKVAIDSHAKDGFKALDFPFIDLKQSSIDPTGLKNNTRRNMVD